IEQNRPVSESPSKVQKSVSKPSVSESMVSPSDQKQNGSQKLSEPRRTISEPQPTKSVQKPVQTNIEQNRPIFESPLLNYIKNVKFVMWGKSGKPFENLRNEKRTFKEHMEIIAKRSLNDATLLDFAKNIKFTIPEPNWEGRLICNSKAETLLERFEKSISDKDLLNRVNKLTEEQQFRGQKQSTIDFER
ncbi:TPA: hypothetical protein ACGO6B_001978, partial [Streptococcus suis]